jgi:hypothetical protein
VGCWCFRLKFQTKPSIFQCFSPLIPTGGEVPTHVRPVFSPAKRSLNPGKHNLVGGFKHFLFSIIYGIILPIDFHIFQDGYCTTNQWSVINMLWIERLGTPDGRWGWAIILWSKDVFSSQPLVKHCVHRGDWSMNLCVGFELRRQYWKTWCIKTNYSICSVWESSYQAAIILVSTNL